MNIRSLLAAYGALFMTDRRWIAGLVLAATLVDLDTGASGLCALLAAAASRRLLGYAPTGVAELLNALFVGLALGAFHAFSLRLAGLALLGGAMVPLLGAALAPVLQRARQQGRDIPLLGAPYLGTAWVLLAAAKALALPVRSTYPYAPAWLDALLPSAGLAVLGKAGALFYVANPLSGLLVLVALLAASRVLTLLALAGGGLAWGLLKLLGVDESSSLYLLAMFNAALAAMLLGGILTMPSRRSLTVALLAVVLTCAGSAALLAVLWPMGVAPLSAPFLLTAWLLRAALRADLGQAWARYWLPCPELAETALATRHLARVRGVNPASVPLSLPFDGAMDVAQGVDGAHTHQGPWRYALDFVRTEAERSYRGDGTVLADYLCFDQPVLAPAAGRVAGARDDLPDNPPGQINLSENWGNHLIIDLGQGDCVMVAHLRQGSLRVRLGEWVAVGQELARCGNSGRSSQPHLHLHVQRGAQLGAPTVPFHLAGCLSYGHFLLDGQPAEGDRLAALPAEPALSVALQLATGRCWCFELEQGKDRLPWQLDVGVGLLGERLLTTSRGASVQAYQDSRLLALFQRDTCPDPALDAFVLAFGLTPSAAEACQWQDAPLAELLPLRFWQRVRVVLRQPFGANLHSRYLRRWDAVCGVWRQSGWHRLPVLGGTLSWESEGVLCPSRGAIEFALRCEGSIGLRARLAGEGYRGDYGMPGWMDDFSVQGGRVPESTALPATLVT